MKNRWLNNDELYHYGVKGMKWGVRRREKREGRRTRKREEYVKKLNQSNKNYKKSIANRKKIQD